MCSLIPVNSYCLFRDFFQVSESHRHGKLTAGSTSVTPTHRKVELTWMPYTPNNLQKKTTRMISSSSLRLKFEQNGKSFSALPGRFQREFIILLFKGPCNIWEFSVLRCQEVEHIKGCFPTQARRKTQICLWNRVTSHRQTQ